MLQIFHQLCAATRKRTRLTIDHAEPFFNELLTATRDYSFARGRAQILNTQFWLRYCSSSVKNSGFTPVFGSGLVQHPGF